MGRLEGKIAIVTGAARGMGAAHARGFVAEGARVVLTDVRPDLGAALATELGDSAVYVDHDVSDWPGWQDVASLALSRFGKIDVLVNNAGILGPSVPIAELDEDDYARVCAVNQHAVFLGMKAVLPAMIAAGKGSIINVSSISGIVANYGFPNAAYVASKFAVRGLTKAAAVEYGKYNIRVNSVHPGFIYTPMMVEAAGEEGGDATGMIPLGRIGRDDEVTQLAIFLGSDESSYITGAEHIIDAGMTVQ
ncbi:glucose 1-dehydrogenase [Sphingopyxis sp. FD7]|uniref:glucose 1-dehydrogenase n=1 Tax=Sphingopyxis sp. FD7 TaxID=1914525 RepID=UPI000DC6366A|nr:glucose 1-dehydrogenase [Sphingopyxis sp. FD7]BBB14393.1 3-alpha-(or 20-beta)-hydroxysteroid dehydrogenase [Sphingopyxis sp. FD7]